MFETTSLFDAMALDESERRTASRRALALAHTRVENHLGAFLSGSVTEEEFDARLAAVRPEMDAYIASACEECGHDHPEHITASLIDNYRVNRRWAPRTADIVVGPNGELIDPSGDETGVPGSVVDPSMLSGGDPYGPYQTEDQYQEYLRGLPSGRDDGRIIGSLEKLAPGKHHMPGVSDKRNRQYEHIKDSLLASGKDEEEAKEEAARTVNKQRAEHGETKSSADKWIQKAVPKSHKGLLHKHLGIPEGEKIPEDRLEEALHSDDDKIREEAQFAKNMKGLHHGAMPTPEELQQAGEILNNAGAPQGANASMPPQGVVPGLQQMPMVPGQQPQLQQMPLMPGQQPQLEELGLRPVAANNPSEQKDDSNKTVTCPECGGTGKAGDGKCPKCGGRGKVSNFGKSVLDKLESSVHEPTVRRWVPRLAETGSGNTDLSSQPSPKMDKSQWTRSNPGMPNEDSKQFPVQHKDPLQPIVMTNRDQDGHDLSEIGEKTTERVNLPAAGDNSGFNTETPGGMAPHTKTFSDGGQAQPVTSESIN